MPHEPGRELSEGEASGPPGRPRNFVAAVLDDEREFRRALDQLTAAGIPREALGVLYGERGAEAIAGRERRWLEELLSDEPSYVDRYEQEIRAGGYVVGVPLPDGRDESRERVRSVLKARGARYIVSSTRWTHSIDE
jgi:hypothetical protein